MHGQEQLALADPDPGLEARLLALRARGHAAAGDSAACLDVVGRAERVLVTAPMGTASPWVSCYDSASLAIDTARCLHRIGHLAAARTQAERVIQLRAPDRVRTHAVVCLVADRYGRT